MQLAALLRSSLPFLAVFAVACSSSTGEPAQPGTGAPTPTPEATEEPTEETPAAPADKCGAAPKKSACKNEGSWIRGIAHFDPTHFKAGAKPVLRVVLRHSFALMKGEETIGGRLHAWTSVPIKDPSKGEVPFAIDMCSTGTAMWSEENGAFHVVLLVDEDDNNDLDTASSNASAMIASTPGATELAKIVDVDVSCNAPSACLDVNIDCKGPSCTTIQPITECKKKPQGCKSDSTFCQ